MRPILHAITPGDHFSPRTGSAVPTVIDGLTRAAAREDGSPEQGVLIAEGTYSDRYPQVTCREYAQAPSPGRGRRVIDAAVGTVSGSRPFQRRELKPLLAEQGTWPPSTVIAHNLVQLIPLVDHTRHQAVLYAHNDLLRTYTQREAAAALAHVALIVCVSSFLAERLKRQLPGAMHRRVVVVPNAADCLQFTAAQEPRTRAAGEPLRVAYLGRVIPSKGADVLLEAAELLGTADLALTVIGSDGFDPEAPLSAFEDRLRQTAPGLASPVRFLPSVDRRTLPEVLRSQDVLVVPSRWPEPWGLTVSEGQASGLVVLASDVGGIPEAIASPKHLFPAGDPHALARSLQELLDDRDAAAEHGRAARRYAEHHDWSLSWSFLAEHLAMADDGRPA